MRPLTVPPVMGMMRRLPRLLRPTTSPASMGVATWTVRSMTGSRSGVGKVMFARPGVSALAGGQDFATALPEADARRTRLFAPAAQDHVVAVFQEATAFAGGGEFDVACATQAEFDD